MDRELILDVVICNRHSLEGDNEKASVLPLARPPPQGFVATLPDPRARPCPGGREGAFGAGLQKEDPNGKATTNG